MIVRQVLGSAIRVEVDDPGVRDHLESFLDEFPERPVGSTNDASFTIARRLDDFWLTEGDALLLRNSSIGELLLALLTRINYLAIDSYQGFAVHAGAVAISDQVIAFPGATRAGKSTLVAGCVVSGLGYVSDEALCLDYETGHVEKYPRALQLDNRALGLLAIEPSTIFQGCSEAVVAPAQLGPRAPDNMTLSHVVFIERRPGPAELSPLDRSQVAAGLLRYSFNHYKRPANAFELVVAQSRQATAWLLRFGDPREAASTVLTEFG